MPTSERTADALRQLGWSPFFEAQLDPREHDEAVPGRVFAVARSGVTVRTAAGSVDLPLGGRWFQYPPEDRPTIGDWVLLDTPMKATTYLLWFGPLLILVPGLIISAVYLRRRRAAGRAGGGNEAPLTEAERAELDRALSDQR
mgnify:CR=1 FL=1